MDNDVMGFLNESDEEQKVREVKLTTAASCALVGLVTATTERLCPASHALTAQCVVWGLSCDECGKQLGPGKTRFGCVECDFDICAQCARVF